MVQAPTVTPFTLLPLTVQTPVVVEVNITASPGAAVAETVPLPATTIAGAAPKVIDWLPFPMVMDFVTCAAAV